jgi:hypothetical protein
LQNNKKLFRYIELKLNPRYNHFSYEVSKKGFMKAIYVLIKSTISYPSPLGVKKSFVTREGGGVLKGNFPNIYTSFDDLTKNAHFTPFTYLSEDFLGLL